MELFTPVKLGDLDLKNRIVMAPLTRRRANSEGVPSKSAALYYAQRASAGLIVSEGTCISPEGIGDRGLPGLWSDEQVERWRDSTHAVHDRGGLIVAQLWHTGRASHPKLQPDGGPAVAPSAIPIEKDRELDGEIIPSAVPRALSTEEIPRVIADYVRAGENAIAAGFDGVEIHGANGYLVDEFLQDASNQRTDEYGGSIENRVRFLREVLEGLTGALGAGRVGLRISPASTFQSMHDSSPYELWSRALEVIEGFDLAYLHLVEPGISGSESHRGNAAEIDSAWVRERYSGRLIAAGLYTAETGHQAIREQRLEAVVYGRLYTSNPDLVERFRVGAPLNPPQRPTFYTFDDVGYIDFPSLRAEELLKDLIDQRVDVNDFEAAFGASEFTGEVPYANWEASWALHHFRHQ